MEKKNALNFLLYSYFGVTRDSDENELLRAAASRAYQDAASRVLVLSVSDDEKDRLRNDGCEALVTFLRKLPVEDYDKAHNALCDNLQKIYSGSTTADCGFTYGIAQKWVNMTMKYIFVLSTLIENKGFSTEYAAKLPEKEMHIPLDSYMLEYIAQKDTKKFVGSPCMKIPAKGENGGETYYSSDKTLAWSKYPDDDTYMKVQNGVREKMRGCWESPLDWEGPAWIEVAKSRKNK